MTSNIPDYKEYLKWQSPKDMFQRAVLEMPPPPKLWDNEYKQMREAWIIAVFAIGYEILKSASTQIKMAQEEPSDAHLRSDQVIQNFQTVERQREGRRRHDEYRKDESEFSMTEYRETSKCEALQWIAQAIGEKEGKGYSSPKPFNLLIYINFAHSQLILSEVAEVVKNLKIKCFDEIWIVSSLWASSGHSAIIGKIFPSAEGFLPFRVEERRVITEKEYKEPLQGWTLS